MSDFPQAWRDVVPLVAPGEKCNWKKHCRNQSVLYELIGNLEGTIARGAIGARRRRFVFKDVDTLVAGCAKKKHRGAYGKFVVDALYGKREVEYALAFFDDKGIIARVKSIDDKSQVGHIVAPHDQCCRVLVDSQGGRRCHFRVGVLKGLYFTAKTAISWVWHGPECDCETCVKCYPR